MAPPSKLTEAAERRLTAALRAGSLVTVACELSGVPRATFYRWRTHHPGLRAAVERARAEADADPVALLNRSAQRGVWRAAARLLVHDQPDRWARPGRS